MSNEEIAKLLPSYVERLGQEVHEMQIPLRSNGSEYKIEDLQSDQQESMAEVLLAIRKYCEGTQINEERVLRLTVAGVAGSGKSTWINTLVTVIRKMFPQDDVISVFAPTGSAAFNAGGETLHKGFGLQVQSANQTDGLSAKKTQYLLARFAKTLVIIIDERSMLDAATLGTAKEYMQNWAHKGSNNSHAWGGIPVIILVGDDFQLPPIMPGAFYALQPWSKPQTINGTQYERRIAGFMEFLKFGETVVKLEGEKRVNDDQEQFKQILHAVRSEDSHLSLSDEDAEQLMRLYLSDKVYSEDEIKQIESEATYVFANKAPRDKLNSYRLKIENLKGHPVARTL